MTSADVLVLIHGYMGSPQSWEESRINSLLEQNGWPRGGLIDPVKREFTPWPYRRFSDQRPDNISYMVDMPWMRPLDQQAEFLNVALQQIIKIRPEEKITLIGHSAGALVARLWLIQNHHPAVVRLISIAAPNLGTPRANDALGLTEPIFPPVDVMRNLFGGKRYNTVRRSRKLVHDFTPPNQKNPNLLYWLNRQPHPDIEYISVVREDNRGEDQDWLVSARSQDLNNVPALRGKSASYIVPSSHSLNWEDGRLLVWLLNDQRLERSP